MTDDFGEPQHITGFLAATMGQGMPATPVAPEEDEPEGRVYALRVEEVVPDAEQPRRTFDQGNLELLAESLRAIGQIQPIEVGPVGPDGKYTIIYGERRWRAMQRAAALQEADERTGAPLPGGRRDLQHINAIIIERAPLERRMVQLVENIHREDLSAMDRAHAVDGLRDMLAQEARIDGEVVNERDLDRRLAQRLNLRSDRRVRDLLAVAALPDEVQDTVRETGLTLKHALAATTIDDADEAQAFLQATAEEGLSANQATRAARAMREEGVDARTAVTSTAGRGGGSADVPPVAKSRRKAYMALVAATNLLAAIDEDEAMDAVERDVWDTALAAASEEIRRIQIGIGRQQERSAFNPFAANAHANQADGMEETDEAGDRGEVEEMGEANGVEAPPPF